MNDVLGSSPYDLRIGDQVVIDGRIQTIVGFGDKNDRAIVSLEGGRWAYETQIRKHLPKGQLTR